MADTLPKLLQEIHSIRTASELQSQLSSLRGRIAALRTDETSIIYAANHTTRELNNKLFNFGLESELDLTQLDGGLRPILSSSGGGGGISNPTYTITLNTGPNTTLTSTKTSAESGESVTITATASDGYTLTSFEVDGTERTSPYTFSMPARNITSSTTAEALTLNAPSLSTSAGDYVFDSYTVSSPDEKTIPHDEDDYQDNSIHEDYHYSITIALTATDAGTVSNNGGTITSYEFSYSTDQGSNWTVLQDTSSKTFSHRFGQSSGAKWLTSKNYTAGQIVHYDGTEYQVTKAHTSSGNPASDTSNYSTTGFKIENFLGSNPYTPWYKVVAKNSTGYESSASTIIKYGFIDDNTTYFTKSGGYWTKADNYNFQFTHFFYMKVYGSTTGVRLNGTHDSSLASSYREGTIVHTAGAGGGTTNHIQIRWEDPNAPRKLAYAGGTNVSTGNWGWFMVTDDYATKMKFVKFDIDNS